MLSEQNEQPQLERAGSFRRSFPAASTLRNELHVAALSFNQFQQPTTTNEYEPTGPADRTFKVVFTGDAAVGKSSFISRLYDGFFNSHTTTTLGCTLNNNNKGSD